MGARNDTVEEQRWIIVTNDDGVYSPGLRLLYEAVKPLGKAIALAPETPKSSSGLGITLHKPLRITRMNLWGFEIHAINGTPSDIIHVAVNELVRSPSLVVSGVNIGDNTSLQVILSSGTVGAALQASLLGIPSIAFSADVEGPERLAEDRDYAERIILVARAIAKKVLDEGLPRGVDLLNVNFPSRLTSETRVKITPPARLRYMEYVEKREDPRGAPYYWLYGKPFPAERDTDVYVVHEEKNICITPIALNMSPRGTIPHEELAPLAWRAQNTLSNIP